MDACSARASRRAPARLSIASNDASDGRRLRECPPACGVVAGERRRDARWGARFGGWQRRRGRLSRRDRSRSARGEPGPRSARASQIARARGVSRDHAQFGLAVQHRRSAGSISRQRNSSGKAERTVKGLRPAHSRLGDGAPFATTLPSSMHGHRSGCRRPRSVAARTSMLRAFRASLGAQAPPQRRGRQIRELDLRGADGDAAVVALLAGHAFSGFATHADRERRIVRFRTRSCSHTRSGMPLRRRARDRTLDHLLPRAREFVHVRRLAVTLRVHRTADTRVLRWRLERPTAEAPSSCSAHRRGRRRTPQRAHDSYDPIVSAAVSNRRSSHPASYGKGGLGHASTTYGLAAPRPRIQARATPPGTRPEQEFGVSCPS